jgi:hypothetical protein
MRTKNFIFLLVLVILLSLLLIILGPSNNENIANIQNLANKHFSSVKEKFKVSFVCTKKETQSLSLALSLLCS